MFILANTTLKRDHEPVPLLVKVGGFGPSGLTNEICYFHHEAGGGGGGSTGAWRHLATVPHVESCNFGCAVLHNQLYIVGGCFNQGLQVFR
jgi:kelch-like protein 26